MTLEVGAALDEGLSFGVVARYESEDTSYQGLIFLSAEVSGAGFEGEGDIATWASNGAGLPQDLSVVPVNDLAKSVSTGIGPLRVPTMATDGAVESQACLAPRPVPHLVGLGQEDAVMILEDRGSSLRCLRRETPS